jgi:NADPH:quinone reductase-like Zn-dependent oxidoreductase
MTAFVDLVVEAALPRGGALLVHAAASGVGLAAIALGRFLGARAAGTTRTAAKIAAIERAGAELAIDTSRTSFVSEVEERWGAKSVDVVLDPIGASTLAGDLRLLAVGGRVVTIAAMSGARTELDLAALLARRARIIGSTLRSRSRAEKSDLVRRFVAEVLPGFETGALAPAVDSAFSPAESERAFDRMRKNENSGKILIDWTRT